MHTSSPLERNITKNFANAIIDVEFSGAAIKMGALKV